MRSSFPTRQSAIDASHIVDGLSLPGFHCEEAYFHFSRISIAEDARAEKALLSFSLHLGLNAKRCSYSVCASASLYVTYKRGA